MSDYPNFEDYSKLYQKYYEGRWVGELIELVGPVENKRGLDLCAGDGLLSWEAVRRGAKEMLLVEKEVLMIDWGLVGANLKIAICTDAVENILLHFRPDNSKFDFVICRQGVNYWLNEELVKNLAQVLGPDGVFVFNTFHRKPIGEPRVKQYAIGRHTFVEVNWLVDDVVHHVQIRNGLPPHTTSFKWLSPEYLQKILCPFFSIEIKKDGATALYRCVKK